MATLQKFKFLATQCAIAGSPTTSPTTSPVFHLRRRRKTLRMLLSRGGSGAGGRRWLSSRCDEASPDRKGSSDGERAPENGNELSVSVSHKLKDLFVSSPPSFSERDSENVGERLLPAGVGGGRRGVPRSLRPLSARFRQRLLRRVWRPVLVAIPE